ncbi:MAG: IS5 family transposase [Williamsia sp.]|nr:IS5 family transposase [Williamsia sp.]
MEVLSKDNIEAWIVPHVSKGKRGSKPAVELWQIIAAILYRLKSGCQWRLLPVGMFFEHNVLTWQGVYYHFRRWVRDGSFKRVWINALRHHHHQLDLSSMQLDGSHTVAKKGGDHTGMQKRKSARTTNTLFLCDDKGLPLSLATPQSGNQHDITGIAELFDELCEVLVEAGVSLEGVFMNADSAFDAQVVHQKCEEAGIEANIYHNTRNTQRLEQEYRYFDELLYKRRYVIERMNAWLDSFKALLVRYETRVKNWMALHFLAFTVWLCRKPPNVKC